MKLFSGLLFRAQRLVLICFKKKKTNCLKSTSLFYIVIIQGRSHLNVGYQDTPKA